MERFFRRWEFSDAKEMEARGRGSLYRVEDVRLVEGKLTTSSGTVLQPVATPTPTPTPTPDPMEAPVEPTPLPLAGAR
jgi:hypothetical protein